MPEVAEAPQLRVLPTERTKAGKEAVKAHVLLYGPPKIGKSTTAAQFNPDHTLFIPTEPGLSALSVYSVPTTSWEQFRSVGAELAAGDHPFQTVVIDTVDVLYKLCSDAVLERLGVEHASDSPYGKGWAAIADEWQLRVSKLASLGLGVWFISHSVDERIEKRVGTITKTVPTLKGKGRDFITGFVDYILLAESEQTQEGERRVLRTRPAENYEAGGRTMPGKPLPDPLPLDAQALHKAMDEAGAA